MKIEVYGRKNCNYCKLAERALQNKSVPYEYKLADDFVVMQQLVERHGNIKRTLPIIVVDGVYIGGYEDLQVFLRENVTEVNGVPQQILKG